MEVSVVIPAYNQADKLYLTLLSFCHQTRDPASFEVVVVDDGSHDETAERARCFVAPYHLQLVSQPNAGRAAARNLGVAEAAGDIIIFNDADRAASHEFVDAHARRHEAATDLVVVGSILEFYFSNLAARYADLIDDIGHNYREFGRFAREYHYANVVRNMYDSQGATDYHIPWISFLSGNVSLRRSTFCAAGGFDDRFKGWGFEHFELGLRLYNTNCKYIFERDAKNYHFAHARTERFYSSNLRSSLDYFTSKHPVPEVLMLEPFLKGEISLQAYEKLAGGSASLASRTRDTYFRRLGAF